MRCLCHRMSHAVYVLGWPLEFFEDLSAEQKAFRSCQANKRDATEVRNSLHGIAALQLAALYDNPDKWLRHFESPSAQNSRDILHYDIATTTRLMNAAQNLPVELLVPTCKRGYTPQHARVYELDIDMPGSFLRVRNAQDLLVPAPPVHLLLRARKLHVLTLALVISEFCGTYRTRPDYAAGHVSHVYPLTSRAALTEFAAALPLHTHGSARFKRALELAFDGSASPRETAIAVLLSLPRRSGGAGFERPELNTPVQLSPEAARLAGFSVIRPDFLWPNQRVCLEYQGAGFHSGLTKAQADNNRAAALEQDGYRCLQVTNEQVSTPEQFAVLCKRLAALLSPNSKPLDSTDVRFLAAHRAVIGTRYPW